MPTCIGRSYRPNIADAVAAGKACEEIDDVWEAYNAFAERVNESLEQEHLPIEDKQHMMSIKEAYGSVLSNMTELTRQVRCEPDDATRQ